MPAPVSAASITKFPHGVSSYGMPVVGGGRILTTGRVFFVDSTAAGRGDDTSHGTAPETPFATVDFAIGQCQADSGDVIFVLPGHTETLLGPAAINCDVSGVSIIGVSYNEGRDRPTFTFATSVTASIDINADNVTIENVVLDMTGIGGLTAGINVKAPDFSLRGCEVLIGTIGNQALIAILTNPNAHRMQVLHNYFHGEDVIGGTTFVIATDDTVGTADGIEIAYNRFTGNFDSAINIDPNAVGVVWTNLYIHHNIGILYETSASRFVVVVDSASTGLIAHNEVTGTVLQGMLLLIQNVGVIENYGYEIGSPQQAGQLIPLIGTGLDQYHSLVDQILGAEMSGSREQLFVITADFTLAAWNTVAKHTILTLSAAHTYRLRILPICYSDLTGTGSLSLGTTNDIASLIALTTGTDIDIGEIWLSATPAKQYLLSGKGTTPGNFIDVIVSNQNSDNSKIQYEITVGAMTGGGIQFHIWWECLTNTTIQVAPAAGTGTP